MNRSDFAAMLKEEIPELKITHCLFHRQALAFKTLPTCLKDTLNSCMKIVNYIRGRALNHRLFLSLCQDVNQNDNHVFLYHTEVRWLSRDRVLNRFLQLRKEIKRFLEDRNSDLVVCFESVEFIQMTAYLADIFNHLNELNLSLQGKEMNMVKASEKLKSFIAKLPLWSRRVQSGNLANFPFLDEILVEGGASLLENVQLEIVAHMKTLSASFNNYFSPGELNVMETWIIDPFKFNVDTLPDDESYKEDLIDLKESRNMKMEFESMVLDNFWSIQLETYPKLAEKALAVLLPFSTTYLCEAGFSSLVYLKNKYRNRLETVENDLRIVLSNRQPRYEKLVDMKRQEKSNKYTFLYLIVFCLNFYIRFVYFYLLNSLLSSSGTFAPIDISDDNYKKNLIQIVQGVRK